jgi:VWFA-related protein
MRRLAAILGLFAGTAYPQKPAVFQTETRVVVVDAVVTDKKGQYVRDLTAKDFRLWEDNKEQPIRSFSRETDTSLGPPRLVFFFDFSGMNVADQASARQAAADFIDATFTGAKYGPHPLLAVVALDESFRVAQSFSDNAARLKKAVLDLRFDIAPGGATPLGARPVGATPPGAAAQSLTLALGNLARNLNVLPGRKTLVLFAAASLLAGAQSSEVTSLAQICNRSNVALYPLLSVTPQISQSDSSTAGTGGFDCDQRRPGTRYTLQPPACAPPDDNGSGALAGATGGLAAPASNDLRAQLQKIAAEQSEYYALSYSPPGSGDEACHSLRLKVDRKNVAVRARSSYCPQKPEDLLAESRVERDLEKHAAAPQNGSAAAAIEVPFFYLAPNVARIHVSMEIPTGALKFENQRGKLQTEINLLGIASAPDGTVAARFSDIVRLSFDNQREAEAFKEMPVHYEKEFRIAPGQYSLAVVFSAGGASFGRVETPLRIDSWDKTRLALSGIALGKETRPASELGLTASFLDEGASLVANGTRLIPSGSVTFDKGQAAFCYFEVYAGSQPPSMRARILDSTSARVKWDGGIARIETPPSAGHGIPVGFGLPIAALPPGSWKLEVTATDGIGAAATRTIDFKTR